MDQGQSYHAHRLATPWTIAGVVRFAICLGRLTSQRASEPGLDGFIPACSPDLPSVPCTVPLATGGHVPRVELLSCSSSGVFHHAVALRLHGAGGKAVVSAAAGGLPGLSTAGRQHLEGCPV